MIAICAVRLHRVWAQVLQTLRGVTLGISRWERAAGTLEPLANTKASPSEFCNTILELTLSKSPHPSLGYWLNSGRYISYEINVKLLYLLISYDPSLPQKHSYNC